MLVKSVQVCIIEQRNSDDRIDEHETIIFPVRTNLIHHFKVLSTPRSHSSNSKFYYMISSILE